MWSRVIRIVLRIVLHIHDVFIHVYSFYIYRSPMYLNKLDEVTIIIGLKTNLPNYALKSKALL